MLIGEQFADNNAQQTNSNNIIQCDPVYMRDQSEEDSCSIVVSSQTGCQMVILDGRSASPRWSSHLHPERKMLTSDCQTNRKHILYIVC